MVDQQALRGPAFEFGTRIRLANGHDWSFPDHPPYKDDPEHLGVLREINESEDASDCRRAELAFAIFLLSRNYNLLHDDFRAILEFAPGDPALPEMQRFIHELANDQIRTLRRLSSPVSNVQPIPTAHWRILSFLRRRDRIETTQTFRIN